MFEHIHVYNFVFVAKKLTNDNKIVNWEKQTACDVDRQYRALAGLLGKFSVSSLVTRHIH